MTSAGSFWIAFSFSAIDEMMACMVDLAVPRPAETQRDMEAYGIRKKYFS